MNKQLTFHWDQSAEEIISKNLIFFFLFYLIVRSLHLCHSVQNCFVFRAKSTNYTVFWTWSMIFLVAGAGFASSGCVCAVLKYSKSKQIWSAKRVVRLLDSTSWRLRTVLAEDRGYLDKSAIFGVFYCWVSFLDRRWIVSAFCFQSSTGLLAINKHFRTCY